MSKDQQLTTWHDHFNHVSFGNLVGYGLKLAGVALLLASASALLTGISPLFLLGALAYGIGSGIHRGSINEVNQKADLKQDLSGPMARLFSGQQPILGLLKPKYELA